MTNNHLKMKGHIYKCTMSPLLSTEENIIKTGNRKKIIRFFPESKIIFLRKGRARNQRLTFIKKIWTTLHFFFKWGHLTYTI